MDVILLHPASAGHGVDGLQDKFSKMVWVQPDWSGDRAAQTIARVWRRGQTAPVHVYWLLAEGTVEEREFLKSESIRENFDLPS
jgi:SNF2 family DNA or RNA helicase